MDKTIIYYTANMELPQFEAKIIANLVKQAGNIPIISVSRKPLRLGKNICVGEKPVCYSNSFRQLLIGLKAAGTKYCLAAESDCLYPPEYFQFSPTDNNNVYRYTNIFIHFDGRHKFWRKSFSEGAQVCNRLSWINSIEKALRGYDSWDPLPNKGLSPIFDTKDEYYWNGINPVISFKTRHGVSFKTSFSKETATTLPYWGSYDEVYDKFLKVA